MLTPAERRRMKNGQVPLLVEPEQKQRRLMLLALTLLVVTLIGVIVRNQQFWFPASPTADSEFQEEPAHETAAAPQTQTQPAQPTTLPRTNSKSHPANPAPNQQPDVAPVVMSRAVLPPLEVEVVAGNQRLLIPADNNSVKVDLQPDATQAPTRETRAEGTRGRLTNVSERVRLSSNTEQAVTRSVEPNYPLLARQMKVQGSVVLQALIRADGNIQDLHVLSGPAILSAAAQEAVRQWRFKPYYQEGRPVETEARITVNFTISAN